MHLRGLEFTPARRLLKHCGGSLRQAVRDAPAKRRRPGSETREVT